MNDNYDYASTSSDVNFSQNKSEHWGNENTSPNKLNTSSKALSFTEIKEIFDDVLSKYYKCQENVKFSIGSIEISMNYMSH